ncbi:cell growth regulator with EF hand domain protein 1 [Danio rerio]|uniref:Cell growth regulator with EF hand domain protein 1 n=2 Tax=Danio rerio TaxID=7955 RepID=A0AB40EB38_DANRE|nr:cell growth regulator with EF hand domain protein 1 [Danio rerio]|eukprot:XP_017207316.1 cell growth regulator with EF hand domain protein 1 [Danio rerio]
MDGPLTAVNSEGVLMRSRGAANMISTRLVFVLILPALTLCAPQVQSLSDGVLAPDLANPFGSSEDNRRLLQSYIKSNLKEGQTSPELNTREQEVFFLFSLYDYDRSGQMDGLELMQLLTDFLTYHEMAPKSTDSVVTLVDYLLQTQDLNQDGLLAPSELLSPSTMEHQDNIPTDPPADETSKQEETGKKPENGDAKNHQKDAEVDQGSEHKNETDEEHKQTPEKAEEQQDQQQPPIEQKLQDDHQELENMPIHQNQPEM